MSESVIEKMARGLFNKFSSKPETWNWDCERMLEPWRDEWRAALRVALSAAEAEGWVLVPKMPTGEMRRAWVAAGFRGDDIDELTVRTGTGQGDLEMIPTWDNVWWTIGCDDRHRAMLEKAPKP